MENQNLNWIEKLNEFISRSVTVKLLSIAFIILLLLIPGSMITSLIQEREDTMKQAVSEVTGKWSGSQQVSGPVLIIPYLFTGTGEDGKLKQVKKSAYFLPDVLSVTSRVVPEKRYRGLYSIIVYRSEIHMTGKFSAPDFASLGIDGKDVLWSQASLQLGIDDLRGVGDTVSLKWGQATYEFNPGITDKKLLNSGIAALLPLNAPAGFKNEFAINLSLRGSENLSFVPVGRQTDVTMTSSWNSPSFTGAFLPVQREVTGQGFQASWKVLHFNRNYPQQWSDRDVSFADSGFGVYFLVPMDHYLKSLRSAKYSVLVIALTFLVYFLFEIMAGSRIHPIQYVMVGLSLCLFYVLLISISEYLGFDWSYLISCLLIILQIFLYSRTLIRNPRGSWLILPFLILIYGFIYIIIQLEKYSLLVGSLGLFIVLTVTMFITKKINWYKNDK